MAKATILSKKAYSQLKKKPSVIEEINLNGLKVGAPVWGQKIKANLTLGSSTYKWDIYIAEMGDLCLLGLDFLHHHSVNIKLSSHSIEIKGEEIFASLVKTPETSIKISRVTLRKRTIVPPNSIKVITGKLEHNLDGDVILQPINKHNRVLMPHSAVHVNDKEVPIQLTNPTDNFVTLKKGYNIGYLEEVSAIFDSSEATADEKSADSSVQRCSISPERIPDTTTSTTPKVTDDTGDYSYKSDHIRDEESFTDSSKDEQSLQQELQEAIGAMPEHVKDLYERSTVHLELHQWIILAKFITEFADIFTKNDMDLGYFTAVQHEIDTGDAKPVCQRMHCTPLGFAEEEEKCLKKMLDSGVIQPSNSEWASPSVLIRKKDGSVHWCVDYRALNKVTQKDAYPLPLIEECLDSLSGVKFMSTLDMNSGYYQFLVAAKDQHKTAFLTKLGLFEFCSMAMGLCNAPATFQRAMQLVF